MRDRDHEPATAPIAPAVEEPARAATWESRAPDAPWWPGELAPHVAWSGEPPPAEHESRADTRGAWHAVGASRRGRLHAHRAEHREDALHLERAGGRLLLVVSDGAGSSRWSRVGATYTCRRLADLVLPRLASPDADVAAALSLGVGTVCAELRALASAAEGASRDLRCTVIAAVLSPSPSGGAAWTLDAVQVGDGVLAVRRRDGAVERLGAGDAGGFSGDVSCFVPDDEAEARASRPLARALDDVDAVLLATDGIEDPFYPIERLGPVLFAQLADGVREAAPGFQRQATHERVLGAHDGAARLLDWLAFEKRGENDDRTLLVAWRASADAR